MKTVTLRVGPHQSWCAVYGPIPGECDCERSEEVYVLRTEAEAAIAKARDDVLEKAARLCDGGPKLFGEAYAERIRELKGRQ